MENKTAHGSLRTSFTVHDGAHLTNSKQYFAVDFSRTHRIVVCTDRQNGPPEPRNVLAIVGRAGGITLRGRPSPRARSVSGKPAEFERSFKPVSKTRIRFENVPSSLLFRFFVIRRPYGRLYAIAIALITALVISGTALSTKPQCRQRARPRT